MAAESTQEIVDAIRDLDDDAKAAIGKELAPHIPVTLGRREMLGVGAAALLGGGGAAGVGQAAQAGVGRAAAADGVLSDIDVFQSGDGTVMTAGNAIQHANEAVSSATTIGNVTFVYFDSSVAGFTITIPASLEKDGIVLYFIDDGGSAGSNNVDVTSSNWNVDGAASHTIDASSGAYILFSHSGEWRSRIFTERVDAGTIATDQATINDLSAVLEKTSDQSISADTDTTVDWDNQDVDTDLYTYDTSNDDIDVLAAGDYSVDINIRWDGISTDGADLFIKLLVNGSLIRGIRRAASGTSNQGIGMSSTLKDLSVNDTIRVDVRSDESNSLANVSSRTWTTITRSG